MADIKSLALAAVSISGRILFPPVCAGCCRQVSQPGTLCGACWRDLRFLEQPWCEVLGTPFGFEMGPGMLSADAIANPPPFDRARAAVAFGGIARQMVHGLKYADRTDLAPWMARWMARAGKELLDEADVLTPVPLHRGRFFARRFNQAAELARALSQLTGVPFDAGLVARVKVTRQQVGLGQRQREDNVRGAFRVPPEAEIRVTGKRIVVIDDVYTTGATVCAVARSLRKAGAAEISVLTYARVLPGDYRPDEDAPI